MTLLRPRGSCTFGLALALAVAWTPVAAQQRVAVSGIVYDSLHHAALPGALVSIVGTARSALADSTGRFRFDSLPPGTYTFAAQHDVVDSLGLSAVSSRVRVADGSESVRLAVPSFGALWRAACPGPPPKDSGFVFGSVRSSRGGRTVVGATVDVTWMDYGLSKARTIAQKRWHNSVNTDSTGGFAVCGVPDGAAMRIRAAADSLASGLIDIPARTERVRRRDLVVGPGMEAVAAERGVVAGHVVGIGGRPIANAKVKMDEAPEVHTSAEGAFVIASVPAGTRQVDITALGFTPFSAVLDVPARDTARVTADLRRVSTLGSVNVRGSTIRTKQAADLDIRRRLGLGQFADSTQFLGATGMGSLFENFTGVHVFHPSGSKSQFLVNVRGIGGDDCVATLFMDGQRRTGQEEMWFMRPEEIGAIEIYPAAMVPTEFQVPRSQCGVVSVWTKFGLGR